MNNIVEGLSRKTTTYQSEQSTVMLLSLDEKEFAFKGGCSVSISKLTDPITECQIRDCLYTLDISKIAQVIGHDVTAALEQMIGHADDTCTLIITKLSIREDSDLLANGLYSWNIPTTVPLSNFTDQRPDVPHMVVLPWVESFGGSIQSSLDNIAADPSTLFTVEFYIFRTVSE